MTRAALHAELRAVNRKLDKLYWIYTRTARGKPPMLQPGGRELYARRAELEALLARRRRRA